MRQQRFGITKSKAGHYHVWWQVSPQRTLLSDSIDNKPQAQWFLAGAKACFALCTLCTMNGADGAGEEA
jgi:hypothetical protein